MKKAIRISILLHLIFMSGPYAIADPICKLRVYDGKITTDKEWFRCLRQAEKCDEAIEKIKNYDPYDPCDDAIDYYNRYCRYFN